MKTLKHWVNVPKVANMFTHEGADIPFDRLGPVKPKLTFKNDGAGAVKVRVVPEGGNIAYGEGTNIGVETWRNPYFRMESAGRVLKQDGPTDFIPADAEVRLPAAGGNRYRFEAMDTNGKIVGVNLRGDSLDAALKQLLGK